MILILWNSSFFPRFVLVGLDLGSPPLSPFAAYFPRLMVTHISTPFDYIPKQVLLGGSMDREETIVDLTDSPPVSPLPLPIR